MSLRLYMDVHVRWAITAGLRRRGLDVLTAQEDGAARFEDPALLDRARNWTGSSSARTTTFCRKPHADRPQVNALAAACIRINCGSPSDKPSADFHQQIHLAVSVARWAEHLA